MSGGRQRRKEFNPKYWAEFTFRRTGDGAIEISVFAADRGDAITTLAQHGITVNETDTVFRSGKYLHEYLAEGTAKQEPIDK